MLHTAFRRPGLTCPTPCPRRPRTHVPQELPIAKGRCQAAGFGRPLLLSSIIPDTKRIGEINMSDSSETPSSFPSVEDARPVLADVRDVLTESRRHAEESRAVVDASLATAREAANAASAVRERVESEQAIISQKSEHIQAAQEHADNVRANLDRTLTAATASATEAEGVRARAQTAATSVDELLSASRSARAQVDSDASAIDKAREDAAAAARTLTGMAARAQEADDKVAAYEQRLAGLEQQCAAQLQAISDLLPGATSAGLASAFDSRRQTFLTPAERWQKWFIGSLIALAILALSELVPVFWGQTYASYGDLARAWLARLPFAAALIWLALHAAREGALAKRLEEDYGYKSAIAASFQGFNEQMSKIAEEIKPESALSKLCSDTLTTLSSPPGRIYDKHSLTMTPADKIQEMIEKVLARKSDEQKTPG
jgi:hypothetical protein